MWIDWGKVDVWQIAAGDANRSYAKYMLDWGVVCIGPGYLGPWCEACFKELEKDKWSSRKLSTIDRFFRIRRGDVVVLRIGTKDVWGVGVVEDNPGDHLWNDAFGDIDGWDLQYLRRVRWIWRRDKQQPEWNEKWGSRTFKMGDSVQRLTSTVVMDWLRGLDVSSYSDEDRLPDLPPGYGWEKEEYKNNKVSVEDIKESLFDYGMEASRVNEIGDEITGLIRLAKWYDRCGGSPSEHETVAYLALPLLRSLGWTAQRMAVEWNRIDVALFSKLPRQDDNLAAVVEAKKRWLSCLSAKWQGEVYALAAGRRKCDRLILTDGIRYAIYLREEDRFPEQPAAYMNLARLYKKYPVLGCDGAIKAITLMAYNRENLAQEEKKERANEDE